MEIFVVASVVLMLANLLLTFGVVRRLREHTQKLAAISAIQSNSFTPFQSISPGTVVPEFSTALTTDGGMFSHADLQGQTSILGFHAIDCKACENDLPAFAERLRRATKEGVSARLVVAVPKDSETQSRKELTELKEAVGESASIIAESLSTGPIQVACEINTYPTYVVVDQDARVVSVAHATNQLPEDLTTAAPQHAHQH